MAVAIRQAKLSDFKTLYNMGKSFPELMVSRRESFMSPKEFRSAITNKDGLMLLAEDDHKIVAFSYCALEGKTYGSLFYVLVLPDYRRHGIGKALVLKSEQWLKKRGMASVYLLGTNQDIVKMMRHLGYKEGKSMVWLDKYL